MTYEKCSNKIPYPCREYDDQELFFEVQRAFLDDLSVDPASVVSITQVEQDYLRTETKAPEGWELYSYSGVGWSKSLYSKWASIDGLNYKVQATVEHNKDKDVYTFRLRDEYNNVLVRVRNSFYEGTNCATFAHEKNSDIQRLLMGLKLFTGREIFVPTDLAKALKSSPCN